MSPAFFVIALQAFQPPALPKTAAEALDHWRHFLASAQVLKQVHRHLWLFGFMCVFFFFPPPDEQKKTSSPCCVSGLLGCLSISKNAIKPSRCFPDAGHRVHAASTFVPQPVSPGVLPPLCHRDTGAVRSETPLCNAGICAVSGGLGQPPCCPHANLGVCSWSAPMCVSLLA